MGTRGDSVNNNVFFEEQRQQSLVKSEIVRKYFWAWAKVIIPSAKKYSGKIAYIDLFAGPGSYQDGTKSTPILILERAIQEPDMRDLLVALFNDADPEHAASLKKAIDSLPGIKSMKYPPTVYNDEVDIGFEKVFKDKHLVPTLLFLDPWGYKGISIELIGSVLKHWGCDCILFFNYNRIQASLTNPKVTEHMDALFGKVRAGKLREQLDTVPAEEKELTIIEAVTEALNDAGATFVLPFCFKDSHRHCTSHHLILATKHHRGYEIMKEIMAKESSTQIQGVPSFEYNPATIRQALLFEYSRPFEDLEGMLISEFAGMTLSRKEIYERHNVGRRFISSNYREALIDLEQLGKIITNPPANQRQQRKGIRTFGDNVKVTFPPKDR
jgi:three-Cys-motif partner protein